MARRRRSVIEEPEEQPEEAAQQEEEDDSAPQNASTKEEQVEAEARIIHKYKSRIKNPITAIRSHCVECMGGQVHEVSGCVSYNCSLYPFRMGKNTMHQKYGKARTDLKQEEPATKRKRKRK